MNNWELRPISFFFFFVVVVCFVLLFISFLLKMDILMISFSGESQHVWVFDLLGSFTFQLPRGFNCPGQFSVSGVLILLGSPVSAGMNHGVIMS